MLHPAAAAALRTLPGRAPQPQCAEPWVKGQSPGTQPLCPPPGLPQLLAGGPEHLCLAGCRQGGPQGAGQAQPLRSEQPPRTGLPCPAPFTFSLLTNIPGVFVFLREILSAPYGNLGAPRQHRRCVPAVGWEVRPRPRAQAALTLARGTCPSVNRAWKGSTRGSLRRRRQGIGSHVSVPPCRLSQGVEGWALPASGAPPGTGAPRTASPRCLPLAAAPASSSSQCPWGPEGTKAQTSSPALLCLLLPAPSCHRTPQRALGRQVSWKAPHLGLPAINSLGHL